MSKGNRVRKHARDALRIPNQDKAGVPPVEHTQVVIDVIALKDSPGVDMQIRGGKDQPHRQLILFKALEAEMRPVMVFNQRVHALMEEDADVKAKVEAYCERLEKEAVDRRKAAESQLVIPTAQQVGETEATKARA